jgi:hypothetical protein
MRIHVASVLSLSTMLALPAVALADGAWENLLVIGGSSPSSVPGVADAVWIPNSLNNPTIDSIGRVSFRGQIGGEGITLANSRLVLLGTPDNWVTIGRDGSALPGGLLPGYVWNTASGTNGLGSSNNISADGGVLVSGTINGPGVTTSTDTASFFVSSSGVASLVAREGDPYPGGGGANITTSMTGSSGTRVSNDGEYILSVSLSGGDVSGSTNNGAIVKFSPAGASVVFRKGDAAPGVEGSTMNPDSFGLNFNDGKVSFGGTLVGGSVTTSNDKALFTNVGAPEGQLRMYAREGDAVPGLTDTVYKPVASPSQIAQPIVGNSLVFFADLAGDAVTAGVNDWALLAESSGSVEVLLRKGESVPGVTDTVFRQVNTSSVTSTPSGTIAYQALLMFADGTTTDVPNASFVGVRKPDGTRITICRQGDAAPGIKGGVFSSLNGSTSICASDSGAVVFANSVSAGTGSVSAIYAWDEAVGLRLLARAGDTSFTGTPVNQLSLLGGTGQNGNGGSTGLNGGGQLVIRAGDSVNSTYAVARIQIGEPSSSCPADLNGDGNVGGVDLSNLLAQWGTAGSADINDDGTVDAVDLSSVLAAWGECP